MTASVTTEFSDMTVAFWMQQRAQKAQMRRHLAELAVIGVERAQRWLDAIDTNPGALGFYSETPELRACLDQLEQQHDVHV